MLAATIVRGGQDGAVQNIFTWVADENRRELAAVGAAAWGGDRVARRGDARVSHADAEAVRRPQGCRVRPVPADERVRAARMRFRAGRRTPPTLPQIVLADGACG